jgi:hypothetical protein
LEEYLKGEKFWLGQELDGKIANVVDRCNVQCARGEEEAIQCASTSDRKFCHKKPVSDRPSSQGIRVPGRGGGHHQGEGGERVNRKK